MDKFSLVGNQEISAVEELYRNYLENPVNVEPSWRNFFEGFELARKSYKETAIPAADEDRIQKEFRIINLITGYRQRGHLFTRTNPVRKRRTYSPTLDYKNFGLEESDLNTIFHAGKEIGIGHATLKEIISHLETTYCESIGAEFLYMRQPELIDWLKIRMEKSKNSEYYTPEQQRHIFYHLNIAVGFESFIHRKFVGAKRFSLEGTEALIPALDALIIHGAKLGIEEFVVGMAHRGRLNVLANILEKPYKNIFKEFYATEYEEGISLGDVKYHLGFENVITTDNGEQVRLSLIPNPSHLETVGSLAEGMVRARIDHHYQEDFSKIAPVIIHGDAAIAGQGIVYEIVQMAQLPGYRTGGTMHIVVNNQVGFTTDYLEARSSTYCTDVAKVTRSPVFHVNGDDVEALIFTVKLALEFRQHFHSDVFIDILSYRKYGHNEGDEPRFTQPLLYKTIASHPNPRDIYAKKLIDSGVMTQLEVDQEIARFDEQLEQNYEASKQIDKLNIKNFLVEEYKPYRLPDPCEVYEVPTAVSETELLKLAGAINNLPADKKFFSKIVKLMEERKQMIGNNRVDWALGELLAYASLLNEGVPVRLSGQDAQRGTFSHRHSALVLEDSGERYFPLKHISPGQATFNVHNSPLNEYAVMGFEYGYSMACPKGLTIWEGQFGDFANVAQVIYDQYICSAGEKWGMMNSLVLYLPHGYEGQGPEHSSARIERYLSLCSNYNLHVVVPTTPANLFHCLRRQVLGDVRIPMIVFTPKSLLRHPKVVSSLDQLTKGGFIKLIKDQEVGKGKAEVVVFTSGKIYFELIERREKLGKMNVAIHRVEQISPFPSEEVREIIYNNSQAKRFLWVQDEPANMGVWPYLFRKYPELGLELVSRPESASPAAGLVEKHKKRLERILKSVFD
ncbi:MAG TPA: 2-oxoglutarate dehydrogenase E1 component [Prolixibacteraceae bacterium]|nr:2-oxoglutarate dehydrogenase E1 component [Prolixibacteraceae bacterium]